jgi:hypothetical protein
MERWITTPGMAVITLFGSFSAFVKWLDITCQPYNSAIITEIL